MYLNSFVRFALFVVRKSGGEGRGTGGVVEATDGFGVASRASAVGMTEHARS